MYYAYEEFIKDLKVLKNKVEEGMGVPDAIVCIARGGMTMSHLLGHAWNLTSIYSINVMSYSDKKVKSSLIMENMPAIKQEHKKILVIDEIVDSGESLSVVMEKLRANFAHAEFKSGVIFQKSSAKFKADFFIREPKAWVDFFWEVAMLEEGRC